MTQRQPHGVIKIIKNKCIATIKVKGIYRKCKKYEFDNKLCIQHHKKYYNTKNNENITKNNTENIINEIIDNIAEKRCNICLEDLDNNDYYITPECCNGKQYYHYKCFEIQLCYYSEFLQCPLCKKMYTTEIINNIFDLHQKKILKERIDEDIYEKCSKVQKLKSQFVNKINLINYYCNLIETNKDNLMTIYEETSKEKNNIEQQLTKSNIILRNFERTLNINNNLTEKIDFMKDNLINYDLI
jgi:hypothetical protein